MANTYINILIHTVFSTKNRESWISSSLRERLYPYMCGIARENGLKVLCIGGTDNHIHILLSLDSTTSIAKAMQLIKGGSSKWIHETFPELRLFSWQEGYGAFSIGISNVDETKKYIENQEKHHRKESFRDEYLKFLRKNNIDFDEKYLWG
ncbi:MAG TPA: IS200/IS605 family transposase [Candidatus Wunengus californicus]|uniref:IS200/IS605 family transposase n=1 Tax=Candidatus Wunengus californicus TaxID=3367619 RepID=UPI00402714E3